MRAGLDVVVHDQAPERETFLWHALERAMPALTGLGLAPDASLSRVTFTTDLGTALKDCHFVQESIVEDVEAKATLLGEIDATTPKHVVIASSSSGFLTGDLRCRSRHGNRIIIGHPFNPPYLLPLVELAGGDEAAKALAIASKFYRSTGCDVVELSREIDGYIANRIQFAVLREILFLLSQGVADVETIDRAIKTGPAMRWAVMGPSASFYVGARDASLYPDFVNLLVQEMENGYVAPPGFKPDAALLRTYVDAVSAGIGSKGQEALRLSRDEGIVRLRAVFGCSRSGSGCPR